MNAPAIAALTPALDHLGVLRAQGEDAARFLQGQLTQDVVLMAPGQTRLAALCNPKGRMLASFLVYRRAPNELLLVTSADLLAATLKRLSMFVLRAKVKLSDASAEFHLDGVWLHAAPAPTPLATDADGAPLLPLPPAGSGLALRLRPRGTPLAAGAPTRPASDWRLAELRTGVAHVTAATQQAFVPQMLNYESVDGVNFKKGCYPGQEVVARSQFRGAIKRRAFVAQVDGPAQAGQEVFAAGATPDQPCGLIAQAAAEPTGGSAVIVSLQSAEHDAALHVGSPDGPRLHGLSRPYALRDDI